MKTLIAYYSHSGNNEKLAYELKERIESDIYKIREMKNRNSFSILFDFLFKRNSKIASSNIDVKEYDNIIFVTPIWSGKIATPMRAFIEREKNNLHRYSLITLCNAEAGQKDKISKELDSLIDHEPQNVMELSINSLLPEDKKNKIKHTFSFRIDKQDFQHFDEIIKSFANFIST